MTQRAKALSRRRFLIAAGAAGTAATAAALMARTAGSGSAAQKTGKRDTRGYHASEHINNYYRTTQV